MRSPKSLVLVGVLFHVAGATAATTSTPVTAPPAPTIEEIGETGNKGASYTPPGTTPTPDSGRRLLTPTPATRIPDAGGTLVNVTTLSDQQVRDLLGLTEESVHIEQLDLDGKLSSPVYGGVTAQKGRYAVTYFYYRYTNRPCPNAGIAGGAVGIGVGIRITALIKTTKANLNVSGLIPLSIAASANQASGTLKIESIGLSSGKATVSSYMTGVGSLGPEDIKKAVESFGVAKAVFETGAIIAKPYYLFVDSPDNRKCVAGFQDSGSTP